MTRKNYIENFVSSILPRNYFLTKSMELTKITTSGTLWYMKKYIVLYNYIFLSGDEINTNEYIKKCIECFDVYIDSLDSSVRDEAYRFFYPEENKINMKTDAFVSFNSFIDHSITYNTREDRIAEYESAKKYYFAYLMQVGGQNGVKNVIKNRMMDDTFKYSRAAIRNIIHLYDLSYNDSKITGLFDDFPAALRNERQILFYYGFFHGKSSFAHDIEFSSLTPLGELALRANYCEFLCLWETQKLKMNSQTVLTKINMVDGLDINKLKINPNLFGVSYNPYLDLLDFLYKYNELDKDIYQYIISRNRSIFGNDLLDNSDQLIENIDLIKERVRAFDTNDEKKEDFDKEIKKYLLGLRSDLPYDLGTNPFGCISYERNSRYIKVTNLPVFEKIYKAYKKIRDYKQHFYITQNELFEKEIKTQYVNKISNIGYVIDPILKIKWDLFNIRTDVNILLYTMIIFTSVVDDIDIITDNSTAFDTHINFYFPNIVSKLGLVSGLKEKIKRIIIAFNREDYQLLEEHVTDMDSLITSSSDVSNADDLFYKIQMLSAAPSEYENGNRVRKSSLPSQLKALYRIRYSDSATNMLKCECCGSNTFITESREPYIEFHHLIPFGSDGPDHYLNLFAICPSCHRKMHYINRAEKIDYYNKLSSNNYLHISFVDRMIEMRKQNILRSYQLEFLLAENAITNEEFDRIIS